MSECFVIVSDGDFTCKILKLFLGVEFQISFAICLWNQVKIKYFLAA